MVLSIEQDPSMRRLSTAQGRYAIYPATCQSGPAAMIATVIASCPAATSYHCIETLNPQSHFDAVHGGSPSLPATPSSAWSITGLMTQDQGPCLDTPGHGARHCKAISLSGSGVVWGHALLICVLNILCRELRKHAGGCRHDVAHTCTCWGCGG